MRLFRIAVRQGTAVPVMALLFASGVSMLLVLAQIIWTGNLRYSYLGWNLFLAWVPLVFALLAVNDHQEGATRRWRFFGFAAAWLLFFPNAPYIFTDLTHLNKGGFAGHFWVDLTLILSCAFTGLVLGFVSLYLMQSTVKAIAGTLASWAFICAVAALSGFGIYVGRFLRFNSWDVLLRPVELYRDLGKWVADPIAHPTTFVFPILFAVFLFISYLVLYALTHLPQPGSLGLRRQGA
jgi:uncharacterized membrane protein